MTIGFNKTVCGYRLYWLDEYNIERELWFDSWGQLYLSLKEMGF